MQIAREIDKSTYLLELYVWERRLLLSVRGVDEMAKKVQELITEEQQVVRNIQTFFALNTLNNELFLNLKQGMPLSENAQMKIQEFLHHDEPSYLKNLSARARYWYFNCLYYHFEIQHKRQRSDAPEQEKFAHLQKALSYLDAIFLLAKNEGKTIVNEEWAFYNAFIDNFMNLCIRLGDFKRVKEIEETLVSQRNSTQLLRSVTFHQITQLLRANDFTAAADYIAKNDVEKRIRESGNSIGESRLHAIRYTCGQAYFLLEITTKPPIGLPKSSTHPAPKPTSTRCLSASLIILFASMSWAPSKKTRSAPSSIFRKDCATTTNRTNSSTCCF